MGDTGWVRPTRERGVSQQGRERRTRERREGKGSRARRRCQAILVEPKRRTVSSEAGEAGSLRLGAWEEQGQPGAIGDGLEAGKGGSELGLGQRGGHGTDSAARRTRLGTDRSGGRARATSGVLAGDSRDNRAINRRRTGGGVGVGETLRSTRLRWLLQAEHRAPQSSRWRGAICGNHRRGRALGGRRKRGVLPQNQSSGCLIWAPVPRGESGR